MNVQAIISGQTYCNWGLETGKGTYHVLKVVMFWLWTGLQEVSWDNLSRQLLARFSALPALNTNEE